MNCSFCPRICCSACVIIPPEADRSGTFKCPYCHIFAGKDGKRTEPSVYRVRIPHHCFQNRLTFPKGLSSWTSPLEVPGGATLRTLFSSTDPSPLLIISIYLEEFEPDGLPPTLIYTHLFSYLPGAIKKIDLPFNLASAAKRHDYATRIRELVHQVEEGNLQRKVLKNKSAPAVFQRCRLGFGVLPST